MEENINSINDQIILPENQNDVQDKDKDKKKEEKKAEETTRLIPKKEEISEDEKEKQYLIKIFHKIEKELNQEENKNKSLGTIYNDLLNPGEEEVKDNIRKEMSINWNKCKYRTLLHFMFLILLPIFTIVNLVGIFQILSVMNILYEAIKQSILCNLGYEEEDQSYEFYNFYGYYITESLNEGIDFDLMTTMSFLGALFFKYSGFIYSSFIFLIINVISIFLVMNFYDHYNDTKEIYTTGQILYLVLCYLLLFIGAGSSALFSQNILSDSFFKYRDFLKKRRDEKDKKISELKTENELTKIEEKKEDEKKEEQEIEGEEEEEEIDIPIYKEKLKEVKKQEEEEKKKLEEKIEGEINENKNSTVYFFLVCLTSVFGFFGKYSLNIVISNRKFEFDSQYNFTNITDDNNTNITNITNITFFTNTTEDENQYEIDAYNEIFNHDRKLFFFIFGIYCASIILSIILFAIFNTIFENDDSVEEEDGNKNIRICQIFGYTIYSNLYTNTVLNKSDDDKGEQKEEEPKKKKGLLTMICVICTCLKYYIVKFCECIKLLICSCKSCCDEIICGYFCCGKKNARCCLCCCCNTISDKQYDIKEHFFCYCYKGQRKLKWFNRLIRNETQKKLIPIMMEFFILQLTTIAFEKKYNELNENEESNYFEDVTNVRIYNGMFVLSLLFFFYITISFGSLFNYITKDEKFLTIKGFVETISNDILNGTYGVLIFNSFYSFFLSLKCLLTDFDEKNESFKSYILFPIFMNKFYFFTFTNVSSVYTDSEDGLELVSFSTLISIYLSLWDTLIGYLTDYIPTNGLFIIQIATSSLIILFTLIVVSIFLCFIKLFWLTFFYILSFIFTFGGVWFCDCFKKHNFYHSCKCCRNHLLPCSKQKCHECCYDCLEKCLSEENYQILKDKVKS